MKNTCKSLVGEFNFSFRSTESKSKNLKGIVHTVSHLLRYVVVSFICLWRGGCGPLSMRRRRAEWR